MPYSRISSGIKLMPKLQTANFDGLSPRTPTCLASPLIFLRINGFYQSSIYSCTTLIILYMSHPDMSVAAAVPCAAVLQFGLNLKAPTDCAQQTQLPFST